MQRIITDLAVIDLTPDGLVLMETAPGVTPDRIRALTEPALVEYEGLHEIAVR